MGDASIKVCCDDYEYMNSTTRMHRHLQFFFSGYFLLSPYVRLSSHTSIHLRRTGQPFSSGQHQALLPPVSTFPKMQMGRSSSNPPTSPTPT
ncbi:hypothetical protein E4U43_007035 [Claviceps pusilla]|uniref:Uncharacterized protein n=1 Tax=Claviceps pusilla TaxID=123648 RepID=A0A9P7NFC9_9HYPO|nr:hypothetical protein E4U43_007035 [Claviceps pusilla]